MDQIDASVAPPRLITWTSWQEPCNPHPASPPGPSLRSEAPGEGRQRDAGSTEEILDQQIHQGRHRVPHRHLFLSDDLRPVSRDLAALETSGITIVPPAASVPKMSYTDRSKLKEESASTRSSAAIAEAPN